MGFDGTTPFGVLYAQCAVEDDERAWGELIRRFHPFVGKVVAGTFQVLSPEKWNAEDVEDAAQEAWYRLMRNGRHHIRAYPDRSEGEFKVYLRTTAANVVRDRLKADGMQKRPRIARLDEETRDYLIHLAPDPAPAPDDRLHTQLIAERIEPLLRRAWQGRPQVDRDIAVCALALMDGLSAQKISELPNIELSRGGVEKVVDRAKKILREHLGGPGARSTLIGGAWGPSDGPVEPWRDLDEVLDFVLGGLDAATARQRIRLLARDAEARGILRGVMTVLDTPLDPELAGRLRSVNGIEIHRRLRARIRRERGSRPLPAWKRLQLSHAAWATAALLLVALGPLLGRLPSPSPSTEAPRLAFEYPQEVAYPMRLAQPFSREYSGPRRSAGTSADRDQMIQVEEELILRRSEGADPVATSNALGHLKLARGQLALAEENYRTALLHDPTDAEAMIGLGVVHYRRAMADSTAEGRSEMLATAEHLLAKIEPSSELYLQALYNRIQVALSAGELERARELLGRYEMLAPEDGWAHALRAAVERAGS